MSPLRALSSQICGGERPGLMLALKSTMKRLAVLALSLAFLVPSVSSAQKMKITAKGQQQTAAFKHGKPRKSGKAELQPGWKVTGKRLTAVLNKRLEAGVRPSDKTQTRLENAGRSDRRSGPARTRLEPEINHGARQVRPRPSVAIQTQMGSVSARIGSLTNEQVGLLSRIKSAEGQRSQAMQSGRHGQMTHASRNVASASTRLGTVNKQIAKLKIQLRGLQKELDLSLAVEKASEPRGRR